MWCRDADSQRRVDDLHRQLGRVCHAVEELLAPDLFNHAFLMNADRQVHLHVVPRYRSPRTWSSEVFVDEHWGELFGREERTLGEAELRALAHAIRSHLAGPAQVEQLSGAG